MIVLVDDGTKGLKKSRLFCRSWGREFRIAPNIFRFAAMTETPVVFFSTSLNRGKLHITIKRPEPPYPASQADIDDYLDQITVFLKNEMIQNQGVTPAPGTLPGVNRDRISNHHVVFF